MKKCPFKVGDQIYNITNDKNYEVTDVHGYHGIICEDYTFNNKQIKWHTPIKYKEWNDYVLLKDVRKIKLQKINADKTI